MTERDDQELDRLINEHFARRALPTSDFETTWQAAERVVARDKSTRWPGYAAAAVLMLGVAALLVTNDFWRGQQPDDQVVGETFAAQMQHEVVSTTLWRAPSDRFLDQTRPLAGWQLPGRNALSMEEVL